MQNRRPPGYENKMWNGRPYPDYEDKMLRMSSQPQRKTPARPQRGRQNLFQYHYQKRLAEQQAAREQQELIELERAVTRLKWQADELENDRLDREEEKAMQGRRKQRALPSLLAHLETLVAEYEASNEGKAAQSVYDHQQLIKKYNSLEYRQGVFERARQEEADRIAQLARRQGH